MIYEDISHCTSHTSESSSTRTRLGTSSDVSHPSLTNERIERSLEYFGDNTDTTKILFPVVFCMFSNDWTVRRDVNSVGRQNTNTITIFLDMASRIILIFPSMQRRFSNDEGRSGKELYIEDTFILLLLNDDDDFDGMPYILFNISCRDVTDTVFLIVRISNGGEVKTGILGIKEFGEIETGLLDVNFATIAEVMAKPTMIIIIINTKIYIYISVDKVSTTTYP